MLWMILASVGGAWTLRTFVKPKNGMTASQRVGSAGLGSYLLLHAAQIVQEKDLLRSWKGRNKSDLVVTSLALTGVLLSGVTLTHYGVAANPKYLNRLLQ